MTPNRNSIEEDPPGPPPERRADLLCALVDDVSSLPVRDDRVADEIIGYDESGSPE